MYGFPRLSAFLPRRYLVCFAPADLQAAAFREAVAVPPARSGDGLAQQGDLVTSVSRGNLRCFVQEAAEVLLVAGCSRAGPRRPHVGLCWVWWGRRRRPELERDCFMVESCNIPHFLHPPVHRKTSLEEDVVEPPGAEQGWHRESAMALPSLAGVSADGFCSAGVPLGLLVSGVGAWCELFVGIHSHHHSALLHFTPPIPTAVLLCGPWWRGAGHAR